VKKLKTSRFYIIFIVMFMFATVFRLYLETELPTGNASTGTSLMIASASELPISPLHVEGGKIFDANDDRLWLRGINFETWIYNFDDGTENANGQFVRAGHLWNWNADKGTSWDTSTAEGVETEQACRNHFEEIKSWGLNCVRFHFSILPWINDVNRSTVDQYRYHLKRCAEIAAEVGIYVIYDVAEYEQHTFSWPEYPFYPYDTNAPSSFDENTFAAWWGEVATYFNNAPNVLFEIYNEPHEGHNQGHNVEYGATVLQHWQTIHNKCIAAIRATGAQNIVIGQVSQGLDYWASSPVGVSWIFDYPLSGGNVVYSAHIYAAYNHLGMDKPYDRAILKSRLTALKVIGPESPVATDTAPLLIGEIGAHNTDTNELAGFSNMLDIFNQEQLHYLGFEWGWPGREFSMSQNEPMMASPSASGQILKNARLTGSIDIDGGAEFSTSTSVTLSLTYTTCCSTVSQVRYSNDGVWDEENWEAPVAIKEWTLSFEDGTKTVYYQIKDSDGLLSSTYSDSIILDTAAPTGSIVINSGDDFAASTSVTLSFTSADATSGVSDISVSNDGIWDTEPWEAPTSTKLWSLTSGNGTKTVYYKIRDKAGLTSLTYYDTIALGAPSPTPTPTPTPTPASSPTPTPIPTPSPTPTPTPMPSLSPTPSHEPNPTPTPTPSPTLPPSPTMTTPPTPTASSFPTPKTTPQPTQSPNSHPLEELTIFFYVALIDAGFFVVIAAVIFLHMKKR
jgi:hypothetical protein